jgi:hypothetical protein
MKLPLSASPIAGLKGMHHHGLSHCFDYNNFVVKFEISKCKSSIFVLFFSFVWLYGLLRIHKKCKGVEFKPILRNILEIL